MLLASHHHHRIYCSFILLFCLCVLNIGTASAQAVINEPVTRENFINHHISLDENSIFNGESFTSSGTETVYYVSSSEGSSGNNGLSPGTSWDLATFNAHRADDSIYLFKRGDIFRGSIDRKMKKTHTRFGAYGTGTRPLFLGSIAISNWQQTTDSRVPAAVRSQVYEADLSDTTLGGTDGINGIKYLFLNRKLMTIARYPNVNAPDQVNWLNIDEKRGDYSFYDQDLAAYTNSPGYWIGATLRARTYSWQYSVRDITGYADGVITTESVNTPWYPIKGWGYFIDNKLEELDHSGEWYYDDTAKKIVFYPPEGTDLNTGLVEGVTYDTGLNVHWLQHDAQVKDLAFKHYLKYCININNSDNVVIEDVNMQYCRQGIYMYNSNTTVIRNNHIDQSFENGINIGKHTDISIIDNTISNNGMFPTYGSFNTALTQGNGINSLSEGSLTVSGNTVVNSTHSGIVMGTEGALVQNNFIQGSMLHINDGGAITLRGNNIQLLDNIIIGVYGDINDGANGYTGNDSTSKHSSYGMGIFDYKAMQGNIISGNTVAYARDIGIMLHEAVDYQVSNNISYANEVQIQAKKGGSDIAIDGNTIFTADNIITGAGKYASHKGLEITGTHTGLAIDNNLYGSLCSESYIFYNGSYDLDSFLHFNGSYDTHSDSHSTRIPKFAIASVVNTLVDEDFEDCENPNQWSNTSVLSGGACSDDTSKTGSRSLVKEDATVSPTYFRIKDEISFKKDKFYNLEFDSYATGKSVYELTIATNIDGEWTRQIPEYSFQLKAQKQHHQVMFQARVDMTQQPIFHVREGDDQQVWIDNFVLQEIAVAQKEKTKIVFDTTALPDLQSDSALLVNKTSAVQSFTLPDHYETLKGETGEITIAPFRSTVIIKNSASFSTACGNGRSLPTNTWLMTAPSCGPSPTGINDQYGSDLGGTYDTDWISFKWDANLAPQQYIQQAATDPLELGVGNWNYSYNAGTLTLSGTATPTEDCSTYGWSGQTCHAINLTPAPNRSTDIWQLVGHPFPYSVDWTDVRIAVDSGSGWTSYTPSEAQTAGYVLATYYRWNGNAYEPKDEATPDMEGTLQPQDAFWLRIFSGSSGLGTDDFKLLVPAR